MLALKKLLPVRALLVSLTLFALAACGGSSSNGTANPPPDNNSGDNTTDDTTDNNTDNNTDNGNGGGEPLEGSRTGTFVDSPVIGIAFSNDPSGITGTTDSQGRFGFEPGDTVTFSIGDLMLPSTMARGVVTPLTLAGTDDPNDPVATNIARLLQSLDADGDASNGLQIPEGAAAFATAVDFSAADFDEQVSELVANSGSSNTTLVSADAARSHLAGSLDNVRARAVGSWYYVDISSEDVEDHSVVILTLLSDGRFALFTDEDDPEFDGFEVGNLEWNVSNGRISLSNVRDYNGEVGFAGSTCPDGGEPQITLDLVSGNSIGDDKLLVGTETGVGGGCETGGDSEVTELTRLYSDTDGRVGTWILRDPDEFILLHLFADGMYAFIGEYNAPEITAGIERGSYSVEAGSNEVTYTQATDTDGDRGLSHPCSDLEAGDKSCGPNGNDISETMTFNAETDQLFFTWEYDTSDDNIDEESALDRVGPTGVAVGVGDEPGSDGEPPVDTGSTYTLTETVQSVSGVTMEDPVTGPDYGVYCTDETVGDVVVEQVQLALDPGNGTFTLTVGEGDDSDSITGALTAQGQLSYTEPDSEESEGNFISRNSGEFIAAYAPDASNISGTWTEQRQVTYVPENITVDCTLTWSWQLTRVD